MQEGRGGEWEGTGDGDQKGGAREQLLLNEIIVLLAPYIVLPTSCVITLRMTVQLTYILRLYNYCLGRVIVIFVARPLLHCNLSKFLFTGIKDGGLYMSDLVSAVGLKNPSKLCFV